MKGKAAQGRKRMHQLSDLMKNRSYTEVKQQSQDRAGWRVKMSQTYWFGSSRRLETERQGGKCILGHGVVNIINY